MGALPYIVGGGVILLVVAAASKAKASTSSSSSSSSSGTAKPTGSTTSSSGTSTTTGVAAPAYLESVPYVIAMRVIQLSDPSLQQAQGVWLTDNGYPLTGAAVQKYSRGEITDLQLRQIAQAEFKAGAVATTPTVTITPKPKGTTAPDTYGTYLLNTGTDDEIYSYALTSPSIPFVTQAAARLAAAGDSRALALTQHLADIST
jgi:hypothetical protein